ncbi:hypothetical protein PsorP6_017851 [Peronosclerospora sorghi]|uniref:Uncharacterized protein n=1 Tax=Peronosclerospora sorghi TaxID=230839 RepID=A0ACC0WCF9_9STRA|nr:hypothetical protein PsorP6_017851 [Peronosclerospora sorghi]
MLDLLSPLRGYIAQNLQFYLSKYIEDIQLEGLGIFGGDLVLNDLEIKRHVLRESLEFPSSFDFSRGFIRELRIHIPWTQLLSQPIEVKLYTIELILTAKSDIKQRVVAPDRATGGKEDEEKRETIEKPKSGWLYDTLQKLLANISVQVNNLVLKYENDDVVFSIALGTLDFYSASENNCWKPSFEELKEEQRVICKRVDAKDVTIFLDRYTNESNSKYNKVTHDPVRRNVDGYEVPVLSRASASVRGKLQLFSNTMGKVQDASEDSENSREASLPHQRPTRKELDAERSVMDVEGLFAYRPSATCDPFYSYSLNRSRVTPIHEIDVFIEKLFFSVSDRQLEMLNQLITSANCKIYQIYEPSVQQHISIQKPVGHTQVNCMSDIPVSRPSKSIRGDQKVTRSTKRQESWFGWAMNVLHSAENEEDELVSELLAETRGALLKNQLSDSMDEKSLLGNEQVTKLSCMRLSIGSASLTLRKHEMMGQEVACQDSMVIESGEELVPVANIGMVKVIAQRTTKKIARPATPVLEMSLSSIVLEVLLPREEARSGMDLVFEIEKVELVSARVSANQEELKFRKGQALLTWGSMDLVDNSNNIAHPYYVHAFFDEKMNELFGARSVDFIDVSGLDANIPVWKTTQSNQKASKSFDCPCDCTTIWKGEHIRCLPIGTITDICKYALNIIGVKERILDGGILSNALCTAWASQGFPISLSKEMNCVFVSVAEEYRAQRNPGIDAEENLVQFLHPHLMVIFSRYTLHSCSATSIHASSSSTDLRKRSFHSAIRLRFASTSTWTECKVTEDHARDENVWKVLDISIGDVDLVLEPRESMEVMEALSIILRRGVEDKTSEEGPMAPDLPSLQSILQSEVKLVTMSSVQVCVPSRPADEEEKNQGTSCCYDLILIARDLIWSEAYRPGSSKGCLQLAAFSAHFERSRDQSTLITFVQALGFELLMTKSSSDQADTGHFVAMLNKLEMTLSLSTAQDLVVIATRVLSSLGYQIPREISIVAYKPKIMLNTFEIQVCRAAFSEVAFTRPRLKMVQRQELHTDIASVSVSWIKNGRRSNASRVIFQGGASPMMNQASASSTSLLKLDISQEKSSGILSSMPFFSPPGLFRFNSRSLAASCLYYHVVVEAKLAFMCLDLEGGSDLLHTVWSLMEGMKPMFPCRKDSAPQREVRVKTEDRVPTSWSLKIELRAAGGEVRVNDALELKVPMVSVSSVDMETDQSTELKPGGGCQLKCTMDDACLRTSKNGVLKDLKDASVVCIKGVRSAVNFSHGFTNHRHAYAVDITLCVSSIEVSLSRLKYLYLLKNPFGRRGSYSNMLQLFNVSQPQNQDERQRVSGHATSYLWYWRFGAQLDLAHALCASDLIQDSRDDRHEPVHVIVDGKVRNTAIAARIGNYSPTKNYMQSAVECGRFTDIQASVGDVQVIEKLRRTRQDVRSDFGTFSRLSDSAFMAILIFLELSDLKRLSESFSINPTKEPSLSSAMLSWYLTSFIAKAFRTSGGKEQHCEAHRVAEIPLLVSWTEAPKTPHLFPLLSGFYRNYNGAGLARRVIACSTERMDLAMTISSLYCFAAVLSVCNRTTKFYEKNHESEDDSKARAHIDPLALPDIEVSILCDNTRVIFPSDELLDGVISGRAVPGNVFIVLDSMSMSSAVRNEIKLDGLGYPPFNSRVLPKKAPVQAQRIGQCEQRLGCRAGMISGYVAELNWSEVVTSKNNRLEGIGPFENHIGRMAGKWAHFSAVERFWSPFNMTFSLEEKSHEFAGICTAIALTKLRFDLDKVTFDVLMARIVGLKRGMRALSRSTQSRAHVKLKPFQPSTSSSRMERQSQREVSFTCDGVELNIFERTNSSHLRIGAITLVYELSTLIGSACVQNVAIGHRTNEDARNSTHAVEEVVFAAYAEPSLWHLSVENYPEKLIAARWDVGDRSEGTLFLDVQAYQAHLSHHFLESFVRFIHSEPPSGFIGSFRADTRHPYLLREVEAFNFRRRWNLKVLVAPSMLSYWQQHPTLGRPGMWLTSGQVFASCGLGSDDKVQHSIDSTGQGINELTRFVAVPTLELMINVDKVEISTSDTFPILKVHFQNTIKSPSTTHTSSTWQQLSTCIRNVSEAQRLVYNCNVRLTGQQHQMLERRAIGKTQVALLYTDLVGTSVQAEINALSVKLSSYSLSALQSLLTAAANSLRGLQERSTHYPHEKESLILQSYAVETTDDFKCLNRMAEGRRPAPGELVLTEALLIETSSVTTAAISPPMVQIRIDPNKLNIQLADVTAFLQDCNKPWIAKGHDRGDRLSSYTGLGNRTHCWMGMRWCYHLPRKICKILATPVPIPPTGVLNGWPSWSWKKKHDRDVARLCDFFCELRYWDNKRSCFALLCEFYVPWEAVERSTASRLEDESDHGSFGDLVSQWFEEDMGETEYRSKLLEFSAHPREFSLECDYASDKWELRWRTPLQSEHESENKQKRLLVNVLLASSVQIHSVLASESYQRVVSSLTLPQISFSLCYAGARDFHDIVTADLNDTTLSLMTCGSCPSRALTMRFSSTMQVYLDNMAQLLTISVIPRTSIDVMMDFSSESLEISTLIGPVSIYLNQTTILVISALPKLLQTNRNSSPADEVEKLSKMRIYLVNCAGTAVWYRQEGTSECLCLPADTSVAYSWLSLASSPFYQLCFAMDDPDEELSKAHDRQMDVGQSRREDSPWCDPCRIKDNGVTGRYFPSHGFLWICVELCGLQTRVTLRSSLSVYNYCEFPLLVKVNGKEKLFECTRHQKLNQENLVRQQRQQFHSNCVSLEGSACTLPVPGLVHDAVSNIMIESLISMEFGNRDDESWCSVRTQGTLPDEFDLVKVCDDDKNRSKQTQCSLVSLPAKHRHEFSRYAWVEIFRAQCRTVLPTDFDPVQPQVSRRYTWIEVSVCPALSVENRMDIPIAFIITQQTTCVKLELAPFDEKRVSVINPCEPVDLELQYDQAQAAVKSLTLSLQGSGYNELKEQSLVFDGCKVVANFSNKCHPMVQLRAERILSVANMTPSGVTLKISSLSGTEQSVEVIESCMERSVGFTNVETHLVISIAATDDSSPESGETTWSPHLLLDVKGDTKPLIVPHLGTEMTATMASTYCIELVHSHGSLKLTIRPLVVVINSTVRKYLLTLSLRRLTLSDNLGYCFEILTIDKDPSIISPDNAGWCVPVCMHTEIQERSLQADVSSWLSSKLFGRQSDNVVDKTQVVRFSCSFRVSLMAEGYEWTDDISVVLPQLFLVPLPQNEWKILETGTTATFYHAPSSTTYRRRLLVRNRSLEHKMLTYTITQKKMSIHLLFFIDHQPPVIIQNQWQRPLGFRNVALPSSPESVGADFDLDYDWSLQVSTKPRGSRQDDAEEIAERNKEPKSENEVLRNWLAASPSMENANAATNERTRFQLGLPLYGWSNTLWQVDGIQFASFSTKETSAPTFLVKCFYRAGSWLITITCLDDHVCDAPVSQTPLFAIPSMSFRTRIESTPPVYKLGVLLDELSLHLCDEHDPMRNEREFISYPEILRATCHVMSIIFSTAPDAPEVSRPNTHLGYLSHIRSYTTLLVSIEQIQVEHFIRTCNFPLILSLSKTDEAKDWVQFGCVQKHSGLKNVMDQLLQKKVPGVENASLLARIIYSNTHNPMKVPSHFNSIEIHMSPAVLQVEDNLLLYMNTFIRPILDGLEGQVASAWIVDCDHSSLSTTGKKTIWSVEAYESAMVSKQQKVYIERFEISIIDVTITARVSIPVLNSFDGIPLHFGATVMRDVFAFPDQLIKDLAADYVADTIVRSPVLLMSLNVLGNPAGFFRSFGQGVRDLVEMPLAASRSGYSPWGLTKGVVGGVASFLGHTTSATLTSLSGFSYSFSRTVDQLTLPSEELRKRHYSRSKHLRAALADGLESLGSSVVGAATGVITTPIAVYKERERQGLDVGFGNVVGGVGMGLVGMIARPLGGVASLVSLASDGLLYGLNGDKRVSFVEGGSRFDAQPNELLRYKLKVLPDAVGSSLVFAHGLWIVPDEKMLSVAKQNLEFISKKQLEAPESELYRHLLLQQDPTGRLVHVTVVCSSDCIYVVGASGTQNQSVLAQTSLELIEAVEENLQQPTVFDLGVKTKESAEWLRFRLPPRQRRCLSHQLRLRLAKVIESLAR